MGPYGTPFGEWDSRYNHCVEYPSIRVFSSHGMIDQAVLSLSKYRQILTWHLSCSISEVWSLFPSADSSSAAKLCADGMIDSCLAQNANWLRRDALAKPFSSIPPSMSCYVILSI